MLLWRSMWMQRLHPQSCQHWWRRPHLRHLRILTPPVDASWPKLENKQKKPQDIQYQQITEMASVLAETSSSWVVQIHTMMTVTEKCSVGIVWYSLKDSTSSSFLTLSNSAVSSIFSSRRVGFLLSIFFSLVNCLNKKNNCTLQNTTTKGLLGKDTLLIMNR